MRKPNLPGRIALGHSAWGEIVHNQKATRPEQREDEVRRVQLVFWTTVIEDQVERAVTGGLLKSIYLP